MKRCFIYQDEKSQKFWNIDIGDTTFSVNYGRLGTQGQTQEKSFANAEDCQKAAQKAIDEKIKKGYTEVSEETVANTADEAKRFSLTYDEQEDEGIELLFKKILGYKKLATLKHMTIANWPEAYANSADDVIKWLIEHKEKFQQLESLHIGDMTYEECEISWIIQANYSQLWSAFPHLKALTVQGSTDLSLGEIVSDHLESIEIICGGLPGGVIDAVTNAKAPNLRKVNLYLGDENYGFDGNLDAVKRFLTDSHFPKLTYLGICNIDYQYADEVAELICHCQYAPQIEVLDMSKSVLTDKGGQVLLDNLDKFPNLQLLDLEYHYLSAKMMEKFRKLPIKVKIGDPQVLDFDEEDEDGERFCYSGPMFTE